MLPEKSQGKVLQATVVAVGPGGVNQVISRERRYHPFKCILTLNCFSRTSFELMRIYRRSQGWEMDRSSINSAVKFKSFLL